ncbi:MAG: TniQ family protein [Xanthomonadales bacterium]|nr:TniQ family protein [Xanthomonadales bacterium]
MIFSRGLFPAHPKPHKDEVLTSWVIRLAKANGLKLQAFNRIVFEGKPDLWNRDMDRKSYGWLIDELSVRTNCSQDDIFDLTLQSYEGTLFQYFHDVGVLKWILPLNVYHRKRTGFGQQYCSECLREDEEPYFRKHWRVAFNTFCSKHQIMHRDRCPECYYPIMFHRNELGKPNIFDGPEMCFCSTCEFDLRDSSPQPVQFIDEESSPMFSDLIHSLQTSSELSLDIEHLAVLRQFCKLINSKVTGQKLCNFLIKQLRIPGGSFAPNYLTFEASGIDHRHMTTQLANWILFDWERRLEKIWKDKVVRYNYFSKDFFGPPNWYSITVQRYNRRK